MAPPEPPADEPVARDTLPDEPDTDEPLPTDTAPLALASADDSATEPLAPADAPPLDSDSAPPDEDAPAPVCNTNLPPS